MTRALLHFYWGLRARRSFHLKVATTTSQKCVGVSHQKHQSVSSLSSYLMNQTTSKAPVKPESNPMLKYTLPQLHVVATFSIMSVYHPILLRFLSLCRSILRRNVVAFIMDEMTLKSMYYLKIDEWNQWVEMIHCMILVYLKRR